MGFLLIKVPYYFGDRPQRSDLEPRARQWGNYVVLVVILP